MEELQFERVSDALHQHGSCVGLLPNPVRAQYGDFVSKGIAVARAAGAGQLFAEAATGTGKTIGYLVAAGLDCVKNRCRSIVATHTIALQRQIIETDEHGDLLPTCDMARALAIVEAQTGVRLTAALRVGRRNFVDDARCNRVVESMLQTMDADNPERSDLEALRSWAAANPGSEFRDFLEDRGLDALPGGLDADDPCVTASTPRDAPAYLAYRAHCTDGHAADIVVTNHALLVRQALAAGAPILEGENDPRPIGSVIVDECDRFPAAAATATSDMVPLRNLIASLEKWNEMCGDDRARPILTHARALYERMSAMRDAAPFQEGAEAVMLWDDMPDSERREILALIVSLGTALSPLMTSGADAANEAEEEVRGYARNLSNVYRVMAQSPVEPGKKPSVAALRWSPSRHYPSLRTFRLYPARLLKTIWNVWTTANLPGADEPTQEMFGKPEPADLRARRAPALILTSATIGAPTRNDTPEIMQMSDEFGIWSPTNACDLMNRSGVTFTPKRFGSVNIVFSDPAAPTVYLDEDSDTIDEQSGEKARAINPEWVAYNVLIAKAASEQGGRVLVLANAYRSAELLAEAMRNAGLPVIEKTRDTSAAACARRLVNDPNGVLVTPTAWEGFDISRFIGPDGQPAKIKHLIVTQLPFAPADSGYSRAMVAYLQRRGLAPHQAESVLHAKIRDNAMRKMRQGFGRGIRGASDSFTFWIGDVRFPRHSAFQSMMPVNPKSRLKDGFANIIPRRFRVNPTGASSWDNAMVLTVSGKLLTRADVADGSLLASAPARAARKKAA